MIIVSLCHLCRSTTESYGHHLLKQYSIRRHPKTRNVTVRGVEKNTMVFLGGNASSPLHPTLTTSQNVFLKRPQRSRRLGFERRSDFVFRRASRVICFHSYCNFSTWFLFGQHFRVNNVNYISEGSQYWHE